MPQELNQDQIDALAEFLNIGVGRAGAALGSLLDARVQLGIPSVEVLATRELAGRLERGAAHAVSAALLGFVGPTRGHALLTFRDDSSDKLVEVLQENVIDPEEDRDLLRTGILSEVGNILLNSVLGTVASMLEQKLEYATPSYHDEVPLRTLMPSKVDPDGLVVIVEACLTVQQLDIRADVVLVFEPGSYEEFVAAIDRALERLERL